MKTKLTTLALAASALALTGCVVQPSNGGYVAPQSQQQQTFRPAPVQQPLKRLIVEGPWVMFERGEFIRRIDIRLVRGGIEVTAPRRTIFAPRVAAGVFQDDQGRTYQFISDTEARFENPNNGRRLRMRRP